VLQADKGHIQTLVELLSARGWCFIEFEEEFKKRSDTLLNASKTFFASPEEFRQLFSYEKHFGMMKILQMTNGTNAIQAYISTQSKHGFRSLTGKRLEEIPVPPSMFNQLRGFSLAIDNLTKKVININQYDIV